jgi:hypothetical protein
MQSMSDDRNVLMWCVRTVFIYLAKQRAPCCYSTLGGSGWIDFLKIHSVFWVVRIPEILPVSCLSSAWVGLGLVHRKWRAEGRLPNWKELKGVLGF